MKEAIERDQIDASNGKNFDEDMSGNDLDIPVSELDDKQENIGSETRKTTITVLAATIITTWRKITVSQFKIK